MILMTDGEQGEGGQPDTCKDSQNSAGAYAFMPSNFNLDGNALGPLGPIDKFTPYGYVMASNPFSSAAATDEERYNEILRKACAAAKSQGAAQEAPIEVYSVAFSDGITSGGPTEATLKACASDPDTNYFRAVTGSELDDTFQTIAKDLFNVRLSN